MKTLYKIVFTCIGLHGMYSLHAQDFPQDLGNYSSLLDQASLTQAGGGVNEFTGAVSYSFNFHTLGADGQGFPISMGYQSNGIKVDEYASSIGLGWSLSAGGSITKITRGLDDLGTNGYHNPGPLRTPENIYNGTADGEKDYYVFNAFGFSGTFYYDETTTSYKPFTGEKITITWQASPEAFIIKDDAGNAYHYTLKETIYTYTYSTANLVNTQTGNWFLTKVVLASKKEISLAYTYKNITGLKTAFSEISSVPYGSCQSNPNHISYFVYNSYDSYKIQSITCGNTVVNFTYSTTARQDIPDDYALQKVEVKRNGHDYKTYVLQQDYHSSRLMLNKVIDHNVNSGQQRDLLSLEYYKDYTMPAPVSVEAKDWLGFFNNQPAYTTTYYSPNFNSLVPAYQTPGTTGSAGIEPGANRAMAAAEVSQTLLLKKITNQYGKTEEFLYEPNAYNVTGANQNGPTNTEVQTYGLRVARVTFYELTQPEKKQYTSYQYKENNVSTGVLTTLLAPPTISGYGCSRIIRLPDARKNRIQAIDAIVAYKQVKLQVYTNPSDVAASTMGYTINTYSIDSPGYFDDTFGGNSTRVFYANRYVWGNLLSSRSLNQAMQLVNQVTYTYEFFAVKDYRSIYVWLGAKLASGQNSVATQHYLNRVGSRRLKSVTSQTFNTSAQPLSITKTELTYDSHGYVSESRSFVNGALKGRTTYRHPYDYTANINPGHGNTKAIAVMNEQQQYAPVIESTRYKITGSTETVTAATINLYKYDFTWQTVLPDQTLTYKTVSPQATISPLSFAPSGEPVYPAAYQPISRATLFDDKQQLTETLTNELEYTTFHNNDNGSLLCTIANAPFAETGFMGFESYEIDRLTTYHQVTANWNPLYTCSYDPPLVNTAFTGNAAFNLALCPSFPILFDKPLQLDKRYTLRYWRKENSGTVTIKINYTTEPVPAKVLKKAKGWELVEHEITGAASLALEGTAIIDDLLLYPIEAASQYSVYNEKELKTAECDASGTCIFYTYDADYRPLFIKDADGHVLKAFEYGIREQQ